MSKAPETEAQARPDTGDAPAAETTRPPRTGADVLAAWREWFQASGVQAALDAQEDAPWSQSGEGWSGEMTCGACPVQIEGEVDGMAFYFRARHGEWSMGIAATAERAIQCRHGLEDPPTPGEWSCEGDDPEGGFMRHSEAWGLVRESIRRWRAELAP